MSDDLDVYLEALLFIAERPLTGNFDDEPRPDGEWSPTALANWSACTNRRASLIFADSQIGPSEAYGGTRRAT